MIPRETLMTDIIQHFPIQAKEASGEVAEGSEYTLDFGPGYSWRANVTR